MAKKLYVGGISYGSNDDALREYFSQAGNVVSATIIMDRMTGRSKGFGFVEMSTDCLLYTSPSPRDRTRSRMPSSA